MMNVRIHSFLILRPATTPSLLDSSHTAFLLIFKHPSRPLALFPGLGFLNLQMLQATQSN